MEENSTTVVMPLGIYFDGIFFSQMEKKSRQNKFIEVL